MWTTFIYKKSMDEYKTNRKNEIYVKNENKIVVEGKWRAAVGTGEEWGKSLPQALLCS